METAQQVRIGKDCSTFYAQTATITTKLALNHIVQQVAFFPQNSCTSLEPVISFAPPEDSHMKRSGILIRKLNPQGRLSWVWLELYLIPKRYHLYRYRLDYHPLFRKGAHASRPKLRDERKWSL